ncbi:MAG TPA: hypothetical protein VN901_24635 [Candidatus Acidoferrales bacterium]|nr:hypothetical protein [Candidatus Acidoferrales bacterium]
MRLDGMLACADSPGPIEIFDSIVVRIEEVTAAFAALPKALGAGD